MIAQPTAQDEMSAFDRLPKALRAALTASGEQFSATQILHLYRRRGSTIAELVAMIKAEDRTPTPQQRKQKQRWDELQRRKASRRPSKARPGV